MKHAAYGLLAALLAQGAYGAIPTTAEGWYKPTNGFKTTYRSAEVSFIDQDGLWSDFSVSVDADGKIVYDESAYDDLGVAKPAFEAMIKALQAQSIALQNTERIETIGKNLYDLTSKTGIEITNPDTGRKFTIKFSSGTIAQSVDKPSGNISATSDMKDPADLKTLNWDDSDPSKLQLYGAKTATSSTADWWDDYGFFVPFLKGNGALGWKRYGGWYSGVFDTMNDNGRTMLTLAGWTGGKECDKTDLKSIMTEESGDNRANHYVLTRYGTGSSAVFHYMPFGGRLDAGCEADSYSIKTNDSGKLTLTGFDEAKPENASDGATIPFVDATSNDLQWAGIENFFSDSVFRKSSTTGKMLLNGTSEEGKVKVLTMTGTGGDDQHVSALTFDARSVDGANGVVQVHGFDTAPSPFGSGVNFTDALTNTSVSIANMSVPLRVPATSGTGYEVKYAPLAKITGIPAAPVDDITIELNETDPLNPYLQLHGAAGDGITLEEGDVYMIGSDGKGKFGKQNGADGDDSEVSASGENSLESYTNSDGERFFRIKGWNVNREGTPHLLGWEANEMRYFEADGGGGVETKTTGAGAEVQLSGHYDAANGAMPYKVNDGNGLGWLAGVDDRVPLLHNNGAPTTMAIGGSLDKANVSAVPTLNVSGFTAGGNCSAKLNKMLSDPSDSSNRSAHQFMARYSSGGGTPSVHWVGIDDVVGGGSPVDGVTITTNTTQGAVTQGLMSLYGWSGAENDTYLSKNEGGSLEWRRVNPMPGVDDTTIATNTSNQLVIKGFATAQNNTIPWKDEEGNFTWGGFSSATNIILAGAGINITDNGGGAITISAQSFDSGGTSGQTIVLSVVTDVRYDETTHKFQKKTCTITFKGSVGTESAWTDVFEAVSHKSEHEDAGGN